MPDSSQEKARKSAVFHGSCYRDPTTLSTIYPEMEILSCVDPASVSKEVRPKVVDVLIIALDCFSFGAV